MAELNLDYYRGSDQYSDGDVEDRILRDVRKLTAAGKAEGPDGQPDAQEMLYGVIEGKPVGTRFIGRKQL